MLGAYSSLSRQRRTDHTVYFIGSQSVSLRPRRRILDPGRSTRLCGTQALNSSADGRDELSVRTIRSVCKQRQGATFGSAECHSLWGLGSPASQAVRNTLRRGSHVLHCCTRASLDLFAGATVVPKSLVITRDGPWPGHQDAGCCIRQRRPGAKLSNYRYSPSRLLTRPASMHQHPAIWCQGGRQLKSALQL